MVKNKIFGNVTSQPKEEDIMNQQIENQRQTLRKLIKLPLIIGFVLAAVWIGLLLAAFFASAKSFSKSFYIILLMSILLVSFITGFRQHQYCHKIDKVMREIVDVRTKEVTISCCRMKCIMSVNSLMGSLFSLHVLRFFDQEGTEYCYPLPDLVVSTSQNWRSLKKQLVGREIRLNCYRGTQIVKSVQDLSMSDIASGSASYNPQFRKDSKP